MKKHIAIFTPDLAEKILSGEKTVDSRFSRSKIIPFGQVSSGDIVYIKPSGKEIIGQFIVRKVIFYDGLTKEDIMEIKKEYGQKISANETFWQEKLASKYATLIFVEQANRFLTSPIKYPKKDLRGWLIID